MHLKKSLAVTLFATVALMAGNVTAQVSNIRVATTPSSLVDNVVLNDIFVDFAGQVTGFQLLVELDSGEIYQNPSALIQPGLQPPVEALEAADPTVAHDSYTAFGGVFSGDNAGNFGLGGGAVNLGGAPAAQFDSTAINQAWNPAGGVNVSDRTDFMAARLAFSDDASGRVLFAGFAGGQDPAEALRLDMPIINGAIIPEPSTIALLGMGLLGLLAWKRRNA